MALKTLTRDSFKWANGRGHEQKPILYSVKNNSLGLGKTLYTAQTDNWWERAFDNSLKSLSVTQSSNGSIKVMQEDVVNGGIGLKQLVVLGKGKYKEGIKFVKGGLLEGTIGSGIKKQGMADDAVGDGAKEGDGGSRKKKRKRDAEDDRDADTATDAKDKISIIETKEDRRKRRKAEKEFRRQNRKAKQVKESKKKSKRLPVAKSTSPSSRSILPPATRDEKPLSKSTEDATECAAEVMKPKKETKRKKDRKDKKKDKERTKEERLRRDATNGEDDGTSTLGVSTIFTPTSNTDLTSTTQPDPALSSLQSEDSKSSKRKKKKKKNQGSKFVLE
ncbi:hypothetical protein BDZ91DRAFT_853796 [Kalaharituber pfeilii]|nr:hypothetical protein BDZ91DRAFT_853796 [Kalaharituber pfeilii]